MARGLFCILQKKRQVTVCYFTRGSSKIASLQPIGKSLSETANTDKFVVLQNFPFVWTLST